MAKKKALIGFASIVLLTATSMIPRIAGQAAAAQSPHGVQVPIFEPDTTFPPTLPNNWVMGNVAKVVVDRHDNVWLIHRPRTVSAGKTAAPPVLEFDATGKFLQGWGGPGAGYDWPDAEHNVLVDYQDNVWISGSSPSGQSKTMDSDDMLIKFTNTGKFIFQMGGRSVSKGSKDTQSVNKPGDIFVVAKTNELYVADGYGNRRVIVFDNTTGAFKRMWGAFGKPPEDGPDSGGRGPSGGPLPAQAPPAPAAQGRPAPPVLDTEGPGSPSFGSPVHSVLVSNDDIVYVGDRSNRRIQLFTPEGKYIKQIFINRAGPATGSVCGLAFSPDPEQRFLYVADFGNSHILVLDRKTLEVLYQFGRRGAAPGDFQGVHHIAVDSKGNLYTGEVAPGARVQRFAYKGLSSTLPPNAFVAPTAPAKP